MSVCLLLIDDGREDYLERSLASLDLSVFDERVTILDPEHKLGFAGAIQAGWDEVLTTDCEFVFHVESDFTFNSPPPLHRMEALARWGWVTQVALKRQPWSPEEVAAGGYVAMDADAFEEWTLTFDDGRYRYLAHRKFWTTNPCLYRSSLCERGWPQESESEGKFGIRLFAEDPNYRSVIWGGKFDPPAVEHIGETRAGVGY